LTDPHRLPTLAELLDLPDSDRDLVLWIQRQASCSPAAVQEFLQQSAAQTGEILHRLTQAGYLTSGFGDDGTPTYRAQLASMRQQRWLGQTAPSPLDPWITPD
jgi:hypothetical protein